MKIHVDGIAAANNEGMKGKERKGEGGVSTSKTAVSSALQRCTAACSTPWGPAKSLKARLSSSSSARSTKEMWMGGRVGGQAKGSHRELSGQALREGLTTPT